MIETLGDSSQTHCKDMYYFLYYKFLILKFENQIDCLVFAFVYYLGVDLGGTDVGVAEQFGDGVQVGSVCKGEGGEAVSGHMKGHMLGYAGFFDESPEADIGVSEAAEAA